MNSSYIIIVGSCMKHVNVIAVIILEIICGIILKCKGLPTILIVKII